jgi:hypothetical protein
MQDLRWYGCVKQAVEINKVAETEIFIEDRVKSLQEVKDWW